MAELLKVFKAITSYSDHPWGEVTEIDKVECFFIFNRHFSKTYPHLSLKLNDKEVDKVAAMDLWRLYIKKNGTPSDFWSKTTTIKEKLAKGEYSEKDIQMIIDKLEIKEDEFNLLYKNHKEVLDEELKYYKKLEKQ